MIKFGVGLAFFVALFCCSLEAGSVKIALWGDSKEAENLADSVVADLSKDRNISFFERKELDKIFREQKIRKIGVSSKDAVQLSKFVHVDLFVVISSSSEEKSKKDARPSSFVIFNAKNGFRLCDSALDQDFEKNEKKIVGSVKNAVNKLKRPKALKHISVLSVRNIGAPEKFNFKLAAIAAEIERQLSFSPNVAVLERDNLFQVNKERNLSKEMYKLAPSAILLDFELSPGKEENIANLTLYLMKSSGKIIKKFEVPDCMRAKSGAAPLLLEQIKRILNAETPEKASSSNSEARRFFSEYKYYDRLGQFEAAQRKLEAAIALAPRNAGYRKKLASFLVRKAEVTSRNQSKEFAFDKLLDAAFKAIEILDAIQEEYPDKKKVYSEIEYMQTPIINIYGNRNKLSKDQKERARKLAGIFRNRYVLLYEPKFKLDDGINNLKEFEEFVDFRLRSERLSYYLDFDLYAKAKFETAELIVKYGGDFLRNNPEILRSLRPKDQGLFAPCILPHYSENSQNEFERQYINSEKLVQKSLAHPLKLTRASGLYLDLMRKTVVSNYDKETFMKNLDAMFKEIDALNLPPWITKDYYSVFVNYVQPFCFPLYSHWDIFDIYYKGTVEYLRRKKYYVSWKLVRDAMWVEKAQETRAELIVWLAPEISSFLNKSGRDGNDARNMGVYWLKKIKGLEQIKPELYKKAVAVLEGKQKLFKVEKLFCLRKKINARKILNAVEYDGKIYILASDSGQVIICAYTPNSNQFEVMRRFEFCMVYRQFIDISSHTPFFINKAFFIIGDKEKVVVCPRNGEKHFIIDNLPAKDVAAVAMLEKRVYVFAGRINSPGRIYPKETVLFSCLPDGTERKIHISTMRRNKQNIFDKNPCIVSNMFADEKQKRLLFMMGKGLWAFYPENEEFKPLFSFSYPGSRPFSWAQKIGGKIYASVWLSNRFYFVCDMKTDNVECVLSDGNKRNNKLLKTPPLNTAELHVFSPFFYQNGQFWFGAHKVAFINSNDISNILSVKGLDFYSCTLFFPCGNGGSVIAATPFSFYKIIPPPLLDR